MASSEMAPYAQTGGLGDVLGSLPAALERLGATVHVVLPAYRTIDWEAAGAQPSGGELTGHRVGTFAKKVSDESSRDLSSPGLATQLSHPEPRTHPLSQPV